MTYFDSWFPSLKASQGFRAREGRHDRVAPRVRCNRRLHNTEHEAERGVKPRKHSKACPYLLTLLAASPPESSTASPSSTKSWEPNIQNLSVSGPSDSDCNKDNCVTTKKKKKISEVATQELTRTTTVGGWGKGSRRTCCANVRVRVQMPSLCLENSPTGSHSQWRVGFARYAWWEPRRCIYGEKTSCIFIVFSFYRHTKICFFWDVGHAIGPGWLWSWDLPASASQIWGLKYAKMLPR